MAYRNDPRMQHMLPSSPTPTNATFRSNGTNSTQFWPKMKKKNEWEVQPMNPYGQHMKQRYLTLAYEDMETIKILPPTFADAEAMAREWIQPPDGAHFRLRVPVEYASMQAARMLQGPYLYITTDDTYQLAQTPQGLRMEIDTDVPLPPEELIPPPPPPPPVLEMPATFNLEIIPGRTVALDTICESDDLDMSKTEDGTQVDGNFWGVLKIVHEGDNHTMDFNGTKLTGDLKREFFFDQRTVSKLVLATKPTTAKCTLTIIAPSQQYVDINIVLGSMWSLGVTHPPAESVSQSKIKYFLRVHPDGYLEHFESNAVVTSLYYEARPDTSQMDPVSYISPSNGFAMSLGEFIPHLSRVLDGLGLSIAARTLFVSNAIGSFSNHKNIAYRFMQPHRLSAAIDLTVTTDPCVLSRIFLMWRGVSEDEMPLFGGSGEKEASLKDWKTTIGFQEDSKDVQKFRMLETSIMECS